MKREKQQNIRLTPETWDWYGNIDETTCRKALTAVAESAHERLKDNPGAAIFPNPVQAHDFILEAWEYIYSREIKGLKGVFDQFQLKIIIESAHKEPVLPQLYGHDFLSTKILAEGLELKCILDKLRDLNNIQQLVLEVWAGGFWLSGHPSMQEYILQLA